ncbi:MAG: hypothetical protein PGN37_16655 [Mycobacterium kyogaense]|uniref:hypothetical protein n=1 Tax=Mycobacterium kyogaense TaxID=2212479 RepID=UPI002FFBAD1B
MRAGKRRQQATTRRQPTTALVDVMKRRFANPDLRSHAQFLADMRAKQAAGQLTNPATAALLDRLERAIDLRER